MDNNKAYAVKIMRTNEVELVKQAKNEFNNLKLFNSHHIIKCYELFYNKSKSKVYTVLEYLENLNTLEYFIQKYGAFSELKAKKLFKMLLEGIHSMHEKGLVHRDIKSANILINLEATQLKIIDFNISKKMSILYDKDSKTNIIMMTHIASIEYSAPEILSGFKSYSEQVDLWSAGIILYYMIFGVLPYKFIK